MVIRGSVTSRDAVTTQRQTRSRRALIRATQDFLAAGQPDFKLQEVAAKAEVVMQTLYNHFPNRDALIQTAVDDALTEWQAEMLAATGTLEDPLEQFAANMRIFARMPDTHPRQAAVIVNSPSRSVTGRRGYSAAAWEHVSGIAAAGLIKPDNLDLALMTTVASTERLMALRALDSSRPAEEGDELAFQNLLIFGVPRAKARKLVERPLPIGPDFGGQDFSKG